MQNAVARYLEDLSDHLHAGSQLSRRSISRFDNFQSLNSRLIAHALETGETGDTSLWVGVNPACVPDLYEVALFTLAVHFFRLNHALGHDKSPRKGDKYQKGKNIFEVVDPEYTDELGYTGIKLKAISGSQSALTTRPTLEYLNERYTPLSADAHMAPANFEPIHKLFKEAMGQKVNIPSFPRKFAIIVASDQLERCFGKTDRKAYPYVHLEGPDRRSQNPRDLQDNLFYIAHNYEDIRVSVFARGARLDVVAFFGQPVDTCIQEDIKRKCVKRVIAIAPERSQRPDLESLLCWQWTPPELAHLQKTEERSLNGNAIDSYLIREMNSADRKELSGIAFPPAE